jgi:deoxyadenosine/deoxycytidine kinase
MMSLYGDKRDAQSILAYWNDDISLPIGKRGTYIAVSGNTGAGKSTLVNLIRDKARQEAIDLVCINERILHHPLSMLMFHFPEDYGLLIQLEFLIHRHLLLYRWLSLGHIVVIERSHLDDRLFMDHLLEANHVTSEEHAAYTELANILDRRIQDPDIYIYLDVKPRTSMERLRKSEEEGGRPTEFPDEGSKLSFVSSWYRKYTAFYESIIAQQSAGTRFQNTELIKWDAEGDPDFMAQQVVQSLKRMIV